MKQLDDVLSEFDFSEELKNYVRDSTDYESFPVMPDDVIVEIEQQQIVSSNNLYLNT